jgi:hypothetical protein
MKHILGTALASVILASGAIGTSASAQSFHDRQMYVERYCDRNPGDPDCYDFRYNRHTWDEDRYHSWYGRHRHEFGPDDAAAAIFGFAAGAITGAISGAASGAVDGSHVARCEARYRSYNPETDMFKGYDGDWHYCRL